jgi:hypothetical protein
MEYFKQGMQYLKEHGINVDFIDIMDGNYCPHNKIFGPKGRGCCSNKVLHSEFNTFLTALKGGVLNPSARVNNHRQRRWLECWPLKEALNLTMLFQ